MVLKINDFGNLLEHGEDVNIKNQTLENIDTNINSQDLADLNINIDAQSTAVESGKEWAARNGTATSQESNINVSGGDMEVMEVYFNGTGDWVTLEMVTSQVDTTDPDTVILTIKLYDASDNQIAIIYMGQTNMPLDLDPAIRIPDGGYVDIAVNNLGSNSVICAATAIVREA